MEDAPKTLAKIRVQKITPQGLSTHFWWREARRAFFVHVGPSNFAFCASVTAEKLHLFGRKLHL